MSGWIEAGSCVAAVLITVASILVGIGGIWLSVKSHGERIQGLEDRERGRDEKTATTLGLVHSSVAVLLERTEAMARQMNK